MKMKLSMNVGFVTNSSFAVHHFPKEVLDHPDVKSFIETYEISQGFIGEDLWYRNTCSTVAMTKDQKKQVVEKFGPGDEENYSCPPKIDIESDDVLIIYGDEYDSIASELSSLMKYAVEEMGLNYSWSDYH